MHGLEVEVAGGGDVRVEGVGVGVVGVVGGRHGAGWDIGEEERVDVCMLGDIHRLSLNWGESRRRSRLSKQLFKQTRRIETGYSDSTPYQSRNILTRRISNCPSRVLKNPRAQTTDPTRRINKQQQNIPSTTENINTPSKPNFHHIHQFLSRP